MLRVMDTALTDKEGQAMSKTFSVIEYFSHFAVRHTPSGDEKPMGDGVDMLFDQKRGTLCNPEVPASPKRGRMC